MIPETTPPTYSVLKYQMFKDKILNKIKEYDLEKLQRQYDSHPNYGKIDIPNFLPKEITQQCADELDQLPLEIGKKFTRKGSCMYEYNELQHTPIQEQLVNAMHSSEFIRWIEQLSGVGKLIPDPHLIGAGYMKSFKGDSLKVHTDFNWVEELHLHRAVSIIIYFNKDWNPDWGGALDFFDFNNDKKISSTVPAFGNMLVWTYHSLVFHGMDRPMTCPDDQSRKGIRIFYYKSNSKPDEKYPPHRSLYWYDKEEKYPYDIRSKK